jgi:hypothetical protein
MAPDKFESPKKSKNRKDYRKYILESIKYTATKQIAQHHIY